jgi:hypothetical protein
MAQEQSKKDKKSEKRKLEAAKELAELNVDAIIHTKRTSKPAQHPDAQYVSASLNQMNDGGKSGGLVAGSRYHYDQGYCNHGKNGKNHGGFWRTEKQEEEECARHYY